MKSNVYSGVSSVRFILYMKGVGYSWPLFQFLVCISLGHPESRVALTITVFPSESGENVDFVVQRF